MSRVLSDHEIFDLLGSHPREAQRVKDHEELFGLYGWSTWDQIAGDVYAEGIELPIPPRGFVIDDNEYGHVVVFPDASGVLRFVTTENESFVDEIAKPVFVSDPDYWELFEEIAAKYKEAAGAAAGALSSDLTMVVAIALVALIVVAGR